MSPRDYPQDRIQSSILEWTLSGKVGLVALKTAMSGWPHSTANENRPLNGLRVLDVSRILADPLCTMVLADFGADVVKVEAPVGDEIRRWGPPFVSDQAAYYYVQKQVVDHARFKVRLWSSRTWTADQERGRARPELHNRGRDDVGVDFERVVKLNPRIIYLSISGFGATQGNRSGFDLIALATSGLMSITGDADGGPSKAGVPISDIASAHYAVMGILGVVTQRGVAGIRSGIAASAVRLDVTLQDASIALLTNHVSNWLLAGLEAQPRANNHPSVAPYGVYTSGDGMLALAVGTDRQFEKLCDALVLRELMRDPRFASSSARLANRDDLRVRLEAALSVRSAAQWHELLNANGVPNGPIRNVSAAVEDLACDLVGTIDDAAGHHLRLLATPVRFDGAYLPPYIAPEPPGTHANEVLDSIGATSSGPDSVGEVCG